MYNRSASLCASIRSLLLPSFSKAIFRGLHTTSSVTCGFSRSYNQPAQVPSSKVTCKSPRSPWINCRRVLALVSMMHSITTLPAKFRTAIEMLSLCTSKPIYLVLVIEGVPFCRDWAKHSNPTPKGRPFIMCDLARIQLQSTTDHFHAGFCQLSHVRPLAR